MRAALVILVALVAAGCAPAPVEVRQYENLGALRAVMVYDDENAVSKECVARTNGKGDDGQPFTRTNACADERNGVIRIFRGTTVRDLLHELCHVENPAARAFCDRVFPGGR